MVEEYRDLRGFLANSITGQSKVGPANEIYAPFDDVVPRAMATTLAAAPKPSPFIRSSRMCASCHVINLPVVDWPLDRPPPHAQPPSREQGGRPPCGI
jgi:hypothetical protein